MGSGFTLLDALIVLVYLVGTIALGLWVSRGKPQEARDYFVGGKELPWWAILFSVVATETSALTLISVPGVAYHGDLTFLQITFGYMLGRIGVAYLLLPRYFQGEMMTAYVLLERRFGIHARRFASITFMFTRAFGDSVRIFATAIPVALIVSSMSGRSLDLEWGTPLAILILGAFTLIVTYFGGMRAVVWTDVVQTAIYLVAAGVAFFIIGGAVEGGWGAILTDAFQAGKLRFIDGDLTLYKAHTLWAGVIGGAFLSLASHGVDQLLVQRLLSSRNLRDGQRAVIWSGVVVFGQFLLFLILGVGLHRYYQGQPFSAPDEIFPRFVMEAMPAGVTGLVVAAILAASTFTSTLNSLSSSTTLDLYLPWKGKTAADPSAMKWAKIFTFMWAVILTGGALLYRDRGTPVVVVALATASFTYGGLLGAFLLGMVSRKASERDVILGMFCGIVAMSLIVFSKQLSGSISWLQIFAGIAWPWYVLIGTLITMSTGWLASRIFASERQMKPTLLRDVT